MPRVNSLTALAAWAQHGVISFPTDTVPAVAALPHNGQLLYELKQRSPDKPLILMGATAAVLWPFVAGTEPEQAVWSALAETYWPGPLTLVLPASRQVPAAMNHTGAQTLGIRVPNHAVARQVMALTGPLATTSANLSGQPALTSAAAIAAAFPTVGLLSDTVLASLTQNGDGPASGVASTVVQWTGSGWQVLRQGTVELAP